MCFCAMSTPHNTQAREIIIKEDYNASFLEHKRVCVCVPVYACPKINEYMNART